MKKLTRFLFPFSLLLCLVCGINSWGNAQDVCARWSNTDEGTSCGFITVPLDWDHPGKENLRLFYVMLKARQQKEGKKPIVFLQGGPGGAATAMVAFFQNSALRTDRDIILLDQRGAGFSSPLCPSMGTQYFSVFSKDLDLEKEYRALLEISHSCSDRLEMQGIDKTAFTSVAIVRDFEHLRNTLKIDQWNILGSSYGSRLGLTYLREYPESLRATALQGLFPPEARLYEHLISNASESLNKVFNKCFNQLACKDAHPELKNIFYQTIARLNKAPYTLEFDNLPFTINAQDYLLMVIYNLYGRNSIRVLPELIESIQQKNDARLRRELAKVENMLNFINGAMYMSVAAYEELPFSGMKELKEEIEHYPELSPGPAFYMSDPLLLEDWHSARAPEGENSPVKSSGPVLLISGDLDPVTPPKNAETMLPHLSNARHIILKNESHSIFSSCYFELLQAFFDSPEDQDITDCYQYDNDLTIQ